MFLRAPIAPKPFSKKHGLAHLFFEDYFPSGKNRVGVSAHSRLQGERKSQDLDGFLRFPFFTINVVLLLLAKNGSLRWPVHCQPGHLLGFRVTGFSFGWLVGWDFSSVGWFLAFLVTVRNSLARESTSGAVIGLFMASSTGSTVLCHTFLLALQTVA